MQRPRETLFLGLFFIPVPRYILRLDKFSSVRVGAYCIRPTNRSAHVGVYGIRPTNASAWRRMTDKPDTFWGVCLCALPIPIKNLIPIYWINLKPGGFWDVCLCDQPHPGEKLLKFVWMHAKPAGDWMKMAISTENPARIGFNMDTAIESSPGIGFHTFSGITFLARMGFVYPHAGYTYSI